MCAVNGALEAETEHENYRAKVIEPQREKLQDQQAWLAEKIADWRANRQTCTGVTDEGLYRLSIAYDDEFARDFPKLHADKVGGYRQSRQP